MHSPGTDVIPLSAACVLYCHCSRDTTNAFSHSVYGTVCVGVLVRLGCHIAVAKMAFLYCKHTSDSKMHVAVYGIVRVGCIDMSPDNHALTLPYWSSSCSLHFVLPVSHGPFSRN